MLAVPKTRSCPSRCDGSRRGQAEPGRFPQAGTWEALPLDWVVEMDQQAGPHEGGPRPGRTLDLETQPGLTHVWVAYPYPSPEEDYSELRVAYTEDGWVAVEIVHGQTGSSYLHEGPGGVWPHPMIWGTRDADLMPVSKWVTSFALDDLHEEEDEVEYDPWAYRQDDQTLGVPALSRRMYTPPIGTIQMEFQWARFGPHGRIMGGDATAPPGRLLVSMTEAIPVSCRTVVEWLTRHR